MERRCEGRIASGTSAVLGQVRAGVELDSAVLGELPFDTRAFVVEKATTFDGKARARIIDPFVGWISIKCVLPIVDRMGEIQVAGKTVIQPSDVGDKSMTYTHFVEVDCVQV